LSSWVHELTTAYSSLVDNVNFLTNNLVVIIDSVRQCCMLYAVIQFSQWNGFQRLEQNLYIGNTLAYVCCFGSLSDALSFVDVNRSWLFRLYYNQQFKLIGRTVLNHLDFTQSAVDRVIEAITVKTTRETINLTRW